jgi:hypothetical protein
MGRRSDATAALCSRRLEYLPRRGSRRLPDEGATDSPSALDRFLASRQETLSILDHCSATDLCRTAVFPGRGPTSVADLVAVMLAHDTEAQGMLWRTPDSTRR